MDLIYKAMAPAKLIISGEHAVVYGQPVLATAINQYMEATITEESTLELIFENDVGPNRILSKTSIEALQCTYNRLNQRYKQFLQQEITIHQVIQHPMELVEYTFISIINKYALSVPTGLRLKIHSNFPVGCGLGASAALIISILMVTAHYFNLHVTNEDYYYLALPVERLQHGYSSGIDLKICLSGGCKFFSKKLLRVPDAKIPRLWIVNSGKPDCTTGACVVHVANHFARHRIWSQFALVTTAIYNAIKKRSLSKLHAAIQANHQLLITLGVVPLKVQKFIEALGKEQAVAKISGAGAIVGDRAGIILVCSDNEMGVEQLCRDYHYSFMAVQSAMYGAKIT